MTIEKISIAEMKEIVPRPSVEIVHNIDDLIEKKKLAEEQAECLAGHINDLQKLIDKALELGCKPTQEAK